MILSPKMIDCILYNRRSWRRIVESAEPKTSTSVVVLPVHRRSVIGTPVETVAVSRATVLMVLDVVDDALRGMPRHLRRVAKLYYDEGYTQKRIAGVLHWSEKTIQRRIDTIRGIVAGHLMSAGIGKLSGFWPEIDRFLSGF